MTPHLSDLARDEIADIIAAHAHTIRPKGCNCMTDLLFKPPVETLAAQLPDIADGTASILADLARNPTPERAERAQQHLRGVQHYVATLREAAKQRAI